MADYTQFRYQLQAIASGNSTIQVPPQYAAMLSNETVLQQLFERWSAMGQPPITQELVGTVLGGLGGAAPAPQDPTAMYSASGQPIAPDAQVAPPLPPGTAPAAQGYQGQSYQGQPPQAPGYQAPNYQTPGFPPAPPQYTGGPTPQYQSYNPRPSRGRRSGRATIITGVIILAVGLVITIGSFALASNGGSYFVSYGAIIIGVITLIRGIIQVSQGR